jgi:hypothetical protein
LDNNEIERYRPIIAVADKEMSLTEVNMEMTQGYPAGSLPGGMAEDLQEAISGIGLAVRAIEL